MNYEERIVVFLDILGFKSLIGKTVERTGNDIPAEIDRVHEALMTVRQVFDLDDKSASKRRTSKKVTQFSDSVVISFLLDEPSELFWTLVEVQHMLLELVSRGILCRGGVALGKLIHSETVIFGPAMVDAYEAETRAAMYPRVILDESILKRAAQYHASHHTPELEEEYLRKAVSKDSDGQYFVDYFEKLTSEFDDGLYDTVNYVRSLKAIIDSFGVI